MHRILVNKVKVRFQDCDPFNHLNNSKYIDYFINAREDHLLENYNLDIYTMALKEGVSWVVASNQISYLRPALMMENVIIESQVISYTTKSLQVELRMYNEDKTELKSVMWSKFVHYNMKTQRTHEHADRFMKLFEEAHMPVEETTFEARIKAMMKKG
ncbi:MAG: thioesterase [Flavobacteriaceae bacterium]|nr:MAG: thioesterase [Flavobacteriaceae bacterium]